MQKLSPNALRDAGVVRFGAGMRAPAALPTLPAALLPPTPPASTSCLTVSAMRLLPTAVADAGRVRFGAGMRRG